MELGRAQLQEHVEDDTTQCGFFICIFLDSRWSRSCLSSCECFRFELRGGGTLRVRCSALVGEIEWRRGRGCVRSEGVAEWRSECGARL